jgi:hypothetical protein
VSLGTDAHGRRIRRSRTFDSRTQAETWIATQQLEHRQLTNPVTDDHLEDYLRWWLAIEAPKGKPGRRPLARTTLAHYQVVVEQHLIPELGHRKVGQLTVRELDDFASRKLAAGYAPATVNQMRETLRSALSTAVRQDRLIRNVARYGGGVAPARPPVDRFTDHELALLLKAARDEHRSSSSSRTTKNRSSSSGRNSSSTRPSASRPGKRRSNPCTRGWSLRHCCHGAGC